MEVVGCLPERYLSQVSAETKAGHWTAGWIVVCWTIVTGVFTPLLTLSIFAPAILIVLAILKCTFYVMNLINSIIYF